MVEKTLEQYDQALKSCKDIFLKKTQDYGTAWRILRPSSLTDQLMIKAKRIRTIENLATQKIADSVDTEYLGIVNYSIMALIQLDMIGDTQIDLTPELAEQLYDQKATLTRTLMIQKNHDYGEAWRDMRLSSLTDLILMKLLRVKQIEDQGGQTIISEGLDANYMDMANYALFALIKIKEQEQ
ncbi:MAG: DUF1599 domain-containing protein [Saprospiraceae bacterium]